MSSPSTPLPFPIFPSLKEMKGMEYKDRPVHLQEQNLSEDQWKDYRLSFEFLMGYGMRSQETFNSYRNDIQTLLLWTWQVSNPRTLEGLRRKDLEAFIEFCHEPPREWVMTRRLKHFEGGGGSMRPNADWRPFRVSQDEMDNRSARIKRKMAHTSLLKTFSTLSSFFEFLVDEDHVEVNMIPSVKKRSPYMIKDAQIKQTHRLSEDQWYYLLETLTELANEDSYYERALFIIVLMKTCYLRVSELSERDAWSPTMGDFFQNLGTWWLKVYGKGKRIRDVTVPDALLPYLTRYRRYRRLGDLPEINEQTPIIPKERGVGNIGKRQLTRLIEEAIMAVEDKMKLRGLHEDAKALSAATTHWFRHTGASIDVNHRPLKHLSDELGHASLATTDRIYVQSDQQERAHTGKNRKV